MRMIRLAGVTAALLAACTPTTTVSVAGGAQNGPFVLGSTVDVSRLGGRGQPTGELFRTSTRDDLGAFGLEVDLPIPSAVEIVAEGFFFDEVSGTVTDGALTLRAFVGVSSDGAQTRFVNPLTHLAARRARHLHVDGATLDAAIAQAEAEVQDALGLVVPDALPDASALDLLGGDTAPNAYLLATSCLLSTAAHAEVAGTESSPTAALQEVLNQIAADLEFDGLLDPPRRAWIEAGRVSMDGQGCRDHLAQRLEAVGRDDVVVPDPFLVTDLDGDGVPDALDPDADGDGILAADDRLVDGAAFTEGGFGGGGTFHSTSVVVIDNRDGDRGGHAWSLRVSDTTAGVYQPGPVRLMRDDGEPLQGIEQVATCDFALPYFLRHHDGTVWTWMPGGSAVLDEEAPAGVVELRWAGEVGVHARDEDGAWHLASVSGSGTWSWQSVDGHDGRQALSASVDGSAEAWIDAGEGWVRPEGSTTARVVGGTGDEVVEVMMVGEEPWYLDASGVVYRVADPGAQAPVAAPVAGVEDVTSLVSRAVEHYIGGTDRVWLPHGTSPALVASEAPVFRGAGRSGLAAPYHVLLGVDGDVHLSPMGEDAPLRVAIPK